MSSKSASDTDRYEVGLQISRDEFQTILQGPIATSIERAISPGGNLIDI